MCSSRAWALLLAPLLLAGCGQKGVLYLPGSQGEVVTRPASPPPETSPDAAPGNSSQSVDSPAAPANPAPEVTAPGTQPAQPPEEGKKDGTKKPPR